MKYLDGSGRNYDILDNPYTYTGNRIYKIGFASGSEKPVANGSPDGVIPRGYDTSLVEVGNMQILGSKSSVFLKNFQSSPAGGSRNYHSSLFRDRMFNSRPGGYVFRNNAVLNVWHDLNPNHWGTFVAPRSEHGGEMDISNTNSICNTNSVKCYNK